MPLPVAEELPRLPAVKPTVRSPHGLNVIGLLFGRGKDKILCWELENGGIISAAGLYLAHKKCGCCECLGCLSWYSTLVVRARARGALVNEEQFQRHAATRARRRKNNG